MIVDKNIIGPDFFDKIKPENKKTKKVNNNIIGEQFFIDQNINLDNSLLTDNIVNIPGSGLLDEKGIKYISNSGLENSQMIHLASSQKILDQVGNMFAQGALQTAAGFLQAMDYDIPDMYDLYRGKQKKYGSALYELGEKLKETSQENFPIYRTGDNMLNPAYFLEQLASGGYTMGMMGETLAASALITALTGGVGAEAGIVNVAKALKKTMAINAAFGSLAGVQEAYINAMETLKNTKEEYKKLGYNDETAYKKGVEAASLGFKMESLPLAAINSLQFGLLRASIGTKIVNGKKLINPFSKIKGMDLGYSSLIPEVKYVPAFLTQSISESLEEGIQQGIQSYSKYKTLQSTKDVFTDWKLWDNEMRDNMLAGAVFGGVFHVMGRNIDKITNGKNNKELGKLYDEFIKQTSNRVKKDINLIKEAKEKKSKEDLEIIHHNIGTNNTLDAIRYDFTAKKDLAFKQYIGTLKEISDAIKNNDTDTLDMYGIEDTSIENLSEYDALIDLASKIRDDFIESYNENGNFSIAATIAQSRSLALLARSKKREFNTIIDNYIEDDEYLSKLSSEGKEVYKKGLMEISANELLSIRKKKGEDFGSIDEFVKDINKEDFSELKKNLSKEDKKNIILAGMSPKLVQYGVYYWDYKDFENVATDKIQYWKDPKNIKKELELISELKHLNKKTSNELKDIVDNPNTNTKVKESVKSLLDKRQAEESNTEGGISKNKETTEEDNKDVVKKAFKDFSDVLDIFDTDKESITTNKDNYSEVSTEYNDTFDPSLDKIKLGYESIKNILANRENYNPTEEDIIEVLNEVLNEDNRKPSTKLVEDLLKYHRNTEEQKLKKHALNIITDIESEYGVDENVEEGNKDIVEIKQEGFKIADSDPYLAFVSLPYELIEIYDENGNLSFEYRDNGVELFPEKNLKQHTNLDYDAINVGTKLTIRIPTDVNNIPIQTYKDRDLGIKGEKVPFGKWKQDKSEEEILKKMPMFIYYNGIPVAALHDEDFYNTEKVAFNPNEPELQDTIIKKGRKRVNDIRQRVNEEGYLNIEVTEKTTGFPVYLKEGEEISLSDNKSEEHITLVYIDNLNNLINLETGEKINDVQIIKKPGEEFKAPIMELRNTPVKGVKVPFYVLNTPIAENEEAFNTLKALIRAKYGKDNNLKEIFKNHGFDLNNMIAFGNLLNLFVNDNLSNFIVNNIVDDSEITTITNLARYYSNQNLPNGFPFIHTINGKLYFGRVNKSLDNNSFKAITNNIDDMYQQNMPAKQISKELQNMLDINIIDSSSQSSDFNKFDTFMKIGEIVEHNGIKKSTKPLMNSKAKSNFIIPIFDNQGNHIRTKNYYSLAKKALKTRVKAFNIGTQSKPKYVTTIQPKIKFDIEEDNFEKIVEQSSYEETWKQILEDQKVEENKAEKELTNLDEAAIKAAMENIDLSSLEEEGIIEKIDCNTK